MILDWDRFQRKDIFKESELAAFGEQTIVELQIPERLQVFEAVRVDVFDWVVVEDQGLEIGEPLEDTDVFLAEKQIHSVEEVVGEVNFGDFGEGVLAPEFLHLEQLYFLIAQDDLRVFFHYYPRIEFPKP